MLAGQTIQSCSSFLSARSLLDSAALFIAIVGFAGSWSCPLAAEPPRVVHVRDYGAVPDGKTECGEVIRAAIRAALETPNAEVAFEAGIYRVRAEGRKGYCFPIQQANRLVVRGEGKATRIVITDPTMGGFSLRLCRQVVLRDLTIDYDPVPFCQGTIRNINTSAGYFDIEVDTDSPTPDDENFVNATSKWGMVIDRDKRRIKAGTPDHYMTPRWEHTIGRVWRFFTAEEHYRRGLQYMEVGDAYVHLARGYSGAVSARGCEGIRIENIQIHASPRSAVGIVGNRGEILVHSLEVRFPENSTRLLTTNADGVHCQQNRDGPVIRQCYFEGMADDAINIYAPPNVLREVRSPTQWLVSSGCLVLAGDRLQVLDPRTGKIRGEVKTVEVKPEGRAFLLTLEKPLAGAVAGADHRRADTIYDLDACGADFQILHNHMNGNRRYGCLLRAGGGVVANNIFEDTTGAGVVLTNEPDWPEGPVPWGVTIRDNHFLRGGMCRGYADSPHGAALVVRATRLGHHSAEAESIHDIVIKGNEFVDCAGTAVLVSGVRNVELRGNRIAAAADVELRRTGGAIVVDHSSRVMILDTDIADPRPGKTAGVEIQANVGPGEAGIRIRNLNAKLSPGAQTIVDLRVPPSEKNPR